MPIICDDCGKEANYKDMPAGGRWIEWMSNPSRGDAAVVAVPCADGVISCVCMPCLQKSIDSMTQESLPDNVGANLRAACGTSS